MALAQSKVTAQGQISVPADVRKKLIKSSNEIEGVSSPDELFMVGQWMGQQHGQSFTEDEYHAGDSGRDSDFG